MVGRRHRSGCSPQLDTDPERGLTALQVAERLEKYGPNELEEAATQPAWRIFLAQFANTMIVVLLVAAGIMVAIGEPTDAIVIGAIVVLNAAIGFFQEYRAEQAMAALRTMAAPSARVVRNGAELIVTAPSWSPATSSCSTPAMWLLPTPGSRSAPTCESTRPRSPENPFPSTRPPT